MQKVSLLNEKLDFVVNLFSFFKYSNNKETRKKQ
jgi:hypothetical protein